MAKGYAFILLALFLMGCGNSGNSVNSSQTLPFTPVSQVNQPNPDLTEDEAEETENPELVFDKSTELTVMTYNIHGIPCMRQNIISGLLGLFGVDKCPKDTWYSQNIGKRMNRLISILKQLEAKNKLPDILLLQEAFRGKVFQINDDAVKRLIQQSPYPHHVDGPDAKISNLPKSLLKSIWKQDGLLNSGLIIFSKYPIVKSKTVKFGNLCSEGNCYAEKGILYAQIKLPKVPENIDIYNTHYQSFTSEENIRKKQNALMFEFMKNNENSPWTIAGGDFNFKNTKDYTTFAQFIKGSKTDHAGLLCLDLKSCKLAKGTKKKAAQGENLDHQFIATSHRDFKILPTMVQYDNFMLKDHKLSDHDYHIVRYKLFWNE